MKLFFTEADFCDAGGYLKSPSFCIEHANKKAAKLTDLLEKILRQDDQRGYPTTTEWHSIAKAAKDVK